MLDGGVGAIGANVLEGGCTRPVVAPQAGLPDGGEGGDSSVSGGRPKGRLPARIGIEPAPGIPEGSKTAAMR